jgi:microcystin-dependent protein
MEPFLGQISIAAFAYAPKGWAMCDGQLLPVAQNSALFSLLGKTYGGDGVNTFGVPDLRGRAVTHPGSMALGGTAGVEKVQLTEAQIPAHSHEAMCLSTAGTQATPKGGVWAQSNDGNLEYLTQSASNTMLQTTALGPGGADYPHDNMPPVLVLNFMIALSGIFPSKG